MSVTLAFQNGKHEIIECNDKITLLEFLKRLGKSPKSPCAGNHTCGKCKIIAGGELSALTESELRLLTPGELAAGFRLSCSAVIVGDVTIIPDEAGNSTMTSFASSREITVKKNPVTGTRDCFTASVDIGTTTIAAKLVKMPECREIAFSSCENPQTKYGADVISRIRYSAGDEGRYNLKHAVSDSINSLLEGFGKQIAYKVVTGNTAMLSLFSGVDATPLGVYPYEAKELFGREEGTTYYPRCSSAFIGGDITCAVLASGMTTEENAFLVDIGTNGEMVVKKDGDLRGCSTAAGPAFEGSGISHGMSACDGAINKVSIEGNNLVYTTIGNTAAKGICGSGLIDAIACMLRLGIITPDGYLEEPYEIADSKVTIDPQDVRALQLAKAAIRAGIETIAPSRSDFTSFYICGGFGEFVDIGNCIAIGLLPRDIADRVKILGNASLAGATMLLKDASLMRVATEIADEINTIQLSENLAFMSEYISDIAFLPEEYIGKTDLTETH